MLGDEKKYIIKSSWIFYPFDFLFSLLLLFHFHQWKCWEFFFILKEFGKIQFSLSSIDNVWLFYHHDMVIDQANNCQKKGRIFPLNWMINWFFFIFLPYFFIRLNSFSNTFENIIQVFITLLRNFYRIMKKIFFHIEKKINDCYNEFQFRKFFIDSLQLNDNSWNLFFSWSFI